MDALLVENVSKAYKRYPNKWSRALEWITGRPQHEKIWVLQDISFSLQAGEATGIIGVNGAGKSTLLKIITGTTQPTAGQVTTRGHVAALLELGMGFHPDFTGRQNALMSGQLLGYSIEQIDEAMSEIESFADIGSYIDQPIRVYSSGMQVRLAFAVATARRPDVLIIDEALSVGDAAFQRKCFQRIENFRSSGSTLMFVSHDTETVKKLCDRAIFLKEGKVTHYGPAKQVCDEYERDLFGGPRVKTMPKSKFHSAPKAEPKGFDPSLTTSCSMSYGNGKAEITTCWLEDINGSLINIIESGESFRWCYHVKFNDEVENPIYAMMVKTREGISVYGVDSTTLDCGAIRFKAGEEIVVSFDLHNFLAPGLYYFNCGIRDSEHQDIEFLSRRVDSAILKVLLGPRTTVLTGVVELGASLSVQQTVSLDPLK